MFCQLGRTLEDSLNSRIGFMPGSSFWASLNTSLLHGSGLDVDEVIGFMT